MAIDFQGWIFGLAGLLFVVYSLIQILHGAKQRARVRVLSEQLGRSRMTLKRVQAQLRARTQRQKLTLRASNDTIFYWNARTGLLRWSANGGRFFGTAPRTRNARRVIQQCVENSDRKRVLRDLQRFLRGGEAVWQAELTLQGPEHARVPVRVKGILVRDASGRPRKMIGALSDMTDAYAAKDAARALARAARLATVGEIAATITHEVSQPLGAILNNAETALFLIRKKRASLDTLREILEDIRNDDLRASKVVRRTRALLQNREMIHEQVNLNKVLAEAVDLVWLQASRRGIALVVSEGSVPSISADAVHLQQVMLNLIGNALDAAEVSITGIKRVDVFSYHAANSVGVSVRDSGSGIPPTHLDSIFESFHTSKDGGLGLGLSISRAIVLAHGGRIFAENNKQAPGATVSFEIPVPVETSTTVPALRAASTAPS